MLLISIGGLYWDMFISLVGAGFLIYGRKKRDAVSIIVGLILMVYPYFISSVAWDIVVGLVLVGIYIFLKRVVRV